MSNLSRFLLLALPLAYPLTGGAGIDTEPVKRQASSIDLQDKAQLDKPQSKALTRASGSKLRCWQYGRLIYESRNIALVERHANGADLRARKGNSDIQVFDMQNGLCILEFS